MINTTNNLKSSTQTQSSTRAPINSLTLAATLFLSDAVNSERSFAATVLPPAPIEASSQARYSTAELARVESFSRFLGANAHLLSSIKNRGEAFDFLVADKVLDAIPLHPLEKRAIELLREHDVDTIQLATLKARLRLKRGSFTEQDMFAGLTASPTNPQRSTPGISEELKADYAKLLAFSQLLAGRTALTSHEPTASKEERFLSSLPPERETVLTQTIGALILNKQLSHDTYAAYFGERLLISKADAITPEEKANIPLLKDIDHYASHPWLMRTFILAQAALGYGLFQAITRRAREAETGKVQS